MCLVYMFFFQSYGVHLDQHVLTNAFPTLRSAVRLASLGKCSVLANAFSDVAGYGLRLLPSFQSIEQIQGVYGDKVAADIERNCAVRLVLRPAGLSDAKKISEQLGTYTFRARSRSMGTWGGGGARTRSPISLGR